MANVQALLASLLNRLRDALPEKAREPSGVAEALAEEDLRSLAHEILASERKAYGTVEMPEAEAWVSFAEALSEALKSEPAAGPNSARSAFSKRVKAFAANA